MNSLGQIQQIGHPVPYRLASLNTRELYPRVSQLLSHGDFPNKKGSDRITSGVKLMTWNVLAQGLTHGFPFAPEGSLSWDHRGPKILEEIRRMSPDILLFQEMNRFDYLMESLGDEYNGSFIAKPDSPSARFGEKADGCAIFTRKSTIEVLNTYSQSFQYMNQVYLAQQLFLKEENRQILAVTTHLKAFNNAKCQLIRQNETMQLLKVLHRFSAQEKIPIVIGADMNETPDKFCYQMLKQSNFKSAYDLFENRDLPEFDYYTTWKIRKRPTKKIIDYIFFSQDDFVVKDLVLPPKNLGAIKIPNWRYPSDHVALCATLQFKN
ncbi:nocturnin [Anaeramoeba flamelloides]|uniref:Nocturnin n=1 Tax=Anaeramoeba flamelloides TaxID=1746091 RepID=A0AAV7YJZ5_9EUKA|nr:nocturnin [Anaeramoeba flamelloides]